MANTTKYLVEAIHNNNLNKERIKKSKKQVIIMCQTLQEYDGNPKVKKFENIGSSNFTNFFSSMLKIGQIFTKGK